MCGLFGCINKKETKLDKVSLISLGIANDVRGGDSCGLVTADKEEKGIGATKLFSAFFLTSNLIKETETCRFMLGHTRKASAGYKLTINEAQPICIYENGKLVFVLTHNGTIDNVKELAVKYISGIDITDKTDSWVMAQIFYRQGYKVLEEYLGAGVFIIADLRKENPEFLMFKGASKLNSWAETVTEERPLYLTMEPNGTIWYSSILLSLQVSRFGNKVYNLSPNILYRVTENGVLGLVEKYDRSNLHPKSTYITYGYDSEDSYDRVGKGYGSYTKTYSKEKPGKITAPGFTTLNNIKYDVDGLYKYHSKAVTGIKKCDKWGYLDLLSELKFPFVCGKLLITPNCFTMLEDISNELKITLDEFDLYYPEVIDYLSYLPEAVMTGDYPLFYIQNEFNEKEQLFSGTFAPVFALNTSYTVEYGMITASKEWSGDSLDKYKTASKKWEDLMDYAVLKSEILKFVNNVK